MNAFAAVMTEKGIGAIATIQVFGDSAGTILNKVFKPIGKKSAEFKTGRVLLGDIIEPASKETIDQVTLGCEGTENFAISCHGNPLIVEMIMQLLQRYGAGLLTCEQLLAKILVAQEPTSRIAVEAGLAMLKTKTVEGAKIIAHQVEAGLSEKAFQWLRNINTMSVEHLRDEIRQILECSGTAMLIIAGCKAAIVGPPNSGKSTLLNCLAGREKAIVTDIKGTTRDWVSAECLMTPLSIEFIDTAGLDEKVSEHSETIEKAAQQKSMEILEQADIVLLILDNSQPAKQLDGQLVEKTTGRKSLTVLNKSDLPAGFDTSVLPDALTNTVRISAKFGVGIENLTEKILQICGVADFNLLQPVCFTSRQENLLKQLKKAKSKQQAALIITELLNNQA